MIENILSNVQMPSRYLGNEINTIHKDWHKVKLHIALAFPDLYEIGTSHFGLQILYSLLNNRKNTLAERVFSPADDMQKKMRLYKLDLNSLESKTPISSFDIVGFSLMYELNYTNMLTMLSLSNIPFLAKERDHSYPLLIAGGPCTFNPEPIADFFDAIVIGDGEETILSMANKWEFCHENKNYPKNNLLKEWSQIKGVYIPSFFDPSYDFDGYQKVSPKYKYYKEVKKAILPDLAKTHPITKPIVPFGKPVHDRLRIELSRGCTRGCRFCQAGMVYRPVREHSYKEIIKKILYSIKSTGYEDISLLSLSTGDYTCIVPLMEDLIEYGLKNNVTVSLPSLRADTLTTKIMSLVKQLRKTGFTIAPEAGSQRLRNVINKNISEDEIIKTVQSSFSLGWKVIKLYFMIGLPTEEQEDLQAIVNLVKKLNLLRKTFKGKNKINVSITTFVPKAHTPFQWVKQISLEESIKKIDWLKKNLNFLGVQFKWQDPHVSFIEGFFARGNRRLSKILISAHEKGCNFDGWSDHFDFSKWQKALEENINEQKPLYFIDSLKPLPWDHINIGIKKKFFLKEFKKSILKETTNDCRSLECQNCGICDFKLISPIFHNKIIKSSPSLEKQKNNTLYKKITVVFSKTNYGKYFGHLEMVKIFFRSLRRANIPIKYSEGFHPSPKVSFKDALPLGMESMNEIMTITIPYNFKINSLKNAINEELPDGLQILKCYSGPPKVEKKRINQETYLIKLTKNLFNQKKLDQFLKEKKQVLFIKNKKGEKLEYDIKQIIKHITIFHEKKLILVINTKITPSLRPKIILNFIFKPKENQLEYATITKL